MNKLFIFVMLGSLALTGQLAWGSASTPDFYEVYGPNPRYRLDDTDADGTYWVLTNDWHVTNSLAVYYSHGASVGYPFVIETDAPDDLLYLDTFGRIGIKTSTPLFELHIVDTVPEIRLEDSSVGAGTVNFQMNSNEFAIEGNSQQDIVEIDTRAPAHSLIISEVGELSSNWIGSETAGDGLKNLMTLTANNSEATLSSDVGFALMNERENFQWNFRTAEFAQGFMATKNGSGGSEFEIRNSTSDYRQVSLYLGNGAFCNSSGQWRDASSREYKENIKELSAIEAMAAFEKLQPVSYTFKKDAKKEPVLGFIAEDVPELVAAQERKSLSALELVALLTKVVQQQQKQIKVQLEQMDAQGVAIRELQQNQQYLQSAVPAATLTGWQPRRMKKTPGIL